MIRISRGVIIAVVILTSGFVLQTSPQTEREMVVLATEGPPVIDGQVQLTPDISPPDEMVPLDAKQSDSTLTKVYSGNEFISTNSDLTYSSSGPAIYALNIPAGGYSFKLPLNLPDGVQITRITVYVVDNDPDATIWVSLYRINPLNKNQSQIDYVSTTGLPTSSSVQSVVMSGTPIATIDNTQYAYCIRYAPLIVGNLHQLAGVKVEYNYPVTIYLPQVQK